MEYIDHVIRAQRGEIGGFEYLVCKFQRMAVGYAFSILHDFQLAEDAAQDAFIIVLNNINKMKDPSAFPLWLKRVTFTCCSRIKRKRKSEISIDDMIETSDEEFDLDWLIKKSEQKELFRKAILQLNENQKEVFKWYYTFNKSYAEIAAELDITEAAVASRLHQAKKKLKSILLSIMPEYLGDYITEETVFMRKIIEGIQNPAQPETMQDDGYVACFAALYMAVEKDPTLDRESVYNKFSTVAAIDFLTFDHTITMSSRRSESEELAKLYGFDDYVEYTMGYAGYQYLKIKKGEYNQAQIYKMITDSLDRDIPVLLETGSGWCVLTGYDDDCLVYGYADHYDGDKQKIALKEHECGNDLFVLHDWYHIMETIVIYTGKKTPTVTKTDIFVRISNIIDSMEEKGYDEKLIAALDDCNFNQLSEAEQKVLFKQTLNWLYYHVHKRAMMCWGMNSDFYPDDSEEDMNLRQSINGYMGSSHDWCWCALRTLGKGGFHVEEDDFVNFLDSEKRRIVLDSVRFVSFHDHKTSCISKIIAGKSVSDLEQYLNLPKYNIPRDQVGPEEMGPFDTEIVMLPERRFKGYMIPINQCEKINDGDVYMFKINIDQGLFYYDKVVFQTSFEENAAGNSYINAGGKYLKVRDKLPIAIYNIVNSWFETNNIEPISDKEMIVTKDAAGIFEAYIPIR